MIKVLFCLQTMVCGGVEKELSTILKYFDYDKYEVSLLLLYVSDEDIVAEIPKNVKIINLNIDREFYCSDSVTLVKKRLSRGCFFEAASLAIKRIINIGVSHCNLSLDGIPNMEDEYDIAVCYHIHSSIMLKYVAEKVKAKKKIGWIHNDFYTTGYHVDKLMVYLKEYDDMVAVSGRVRDEFVDLCPDYKGNVSVAHNVVDEELIKALALQIPNDKFFDDKGIKILSVGRFTQQKGFDIAIEIANDLRRKGLVFHWYLIGYGEEEQRYRGLICEYNLQDTFYILGRKSNPYPYIANCDIFAQPSRHEAYSISILEAKIFSRPILCSDFAGAEEQIDNEKTGYIVPISKRDAFEDRLEKMILDKDDRKRLESELCHSVDNHKDLIKIMSFFSN